MQGVAKLEPRKGYVGLVDVERPELESDEALVEVAYAGLCGSDAGIYKFKDAYEFMDLPTVIGHEYAGTVVEVGDDVDQFEPGDAVVERIIRSCGECYQCETGSPNVCQDLQATGVHTDGAWRPYIAVPEDALHPVPDKVPLRRAALTEPTSVAARAVIHNSRIRAGDSVLVQGPGPIGLLSAQVARAEGGDVVVSGVDRDETHRLPIAEELGFPTVNAMESDPAEVAADHARVDGFDVVIDSTGHESGVRGAVEAVRRAGQVVLVGLPGSFELNFATLVREEIDFQASYASVWEDFERALRLIESEAVDIDPLIDDRFSLRDPEPAFEAFLAGETVKPVFDVNELYNS